jgi:signal transduction histidine kinase
MGEMLTLDADPLQMRQLLQNLIGNALKFHTPEEPPLVRVWCERAASVVDDKESAWGDLCRIHVADNGIGFDEKYLDRIFTVFQRLHGRHAYEGTGVGLAVCRRIAERHGGSITAKSEPGRGSTFVVTLPASQHAGGRD